eukprot:9473258-Pyramimonas_sp.AAC.1
MILARKDRLPVVRSPVSDSAAAKTKSRADVSSFCFLRTSRRAIAANAGGRVAWQARAIRNPLSAASGIVMKCQKFKQRHTLVGRLNGHLAACRTCRAGARPPRLLSAELPALARNRTARCRALEFDDTFALSGVVAAIAWFGRVDTIVWTGSRRHRTVDTRSLDTI